MEPFSSLRHDLTNLINGRSLSHGEQGLFEQLMLHKTALFKIFDIPPRNANELKEVQSGKVTINSKQVAINLEFALQVNYISDQLNCSERLVAGLLLDVVAEHPNLTASRYLEMVLLEYHLRRRQLADCLRLIFEAVNLDDPNTNPTIGRILHYAMVELNTAPTRPSQPSFSSIILNEIDFLGITLDATENARQGAPTNTVTPTAQNNDVLLGVDVLAARCESLKYERRQLGLTLYFIALQGLLTPLDVKFIVEWLFRNNNHAMTYYMLTALMTMFDIVNPATPGGVRRESVAKHPPTISYMKTKLSSPGWKDPSLQAVLLMKWTLLLTDMRRRDGNLEAVDGFMSNQLEANIWGAVQGNAFTFMSTAVIHLQRRQGSLRLPALLQPITLEHADKREIPTEDLKAIFLQSLAAVVQTCLSLAPSELRKIKQKQEDLVLANARGAPRAPSRFSAPVTAPLAHSPPRNDIAVLYSLLGVLYSSLPPDYALPFWGATPRHSLSYVESKEINEGRLPAFLQWAVWSVTPQDTTMMTAMYDMLTGLATGQQCSELTHNFMVRGGVEVIPDSTMPPTSSGGGVLSWGVIFTKLDTWASSGTNTRAPPTQSLGHGFVNNSQQSVQQPVLNPKDVVMAQSFLHLLSTVVTYSVSVRATITSHHQFRAIPTMISLIPLSIPLELKGTLFETLSAFCEPGAGSVGVEICKAVWTLMERYEVINVKPPSQSGFAGNLMNVKGLEVELEIEASHGQYPATIPFLGLLCTLIHTVKRVSLRDRITDPSTLSTIPETLGQPYRLPGIGPFVEFVVDIMFANIPTREYARVSDMWKMNDLCLRFIERCLASYDIESLLVSAEAGPLKPDSVLTLLVHPGYEIMRRMLTTTPLHQSITGYLVEGVAGFDNGFAEEPLFASTIVRTLRIMQRVLEIQDIFLDIFVPILSDFDGASSVGVVHPRSYFTRFDQSLTFAPQYIPALSSYVAYPAHPELVLLSVKIMSALSLSPALSNMATLLQRSDNSGRIMAAYIHILQSESFDEVLAAETSADQATGAGAPDVDPSLDLAQATRLAVLDLLIQGIQVNRSHQSFARWLLFGSIKKNQQIEDPRALGAHQTCVHLVIELLNIGVPRLKGKGKQTTRGTPMFFAIPALAERCYHIIHSLCIDPATSELTMRYLRTREDFFARHIAAMPMQGPRTDVEPFIEVVYSDGTRLPTTVATFSAFLRSRSWMFSLIALELQVLMNKNQHKGVDELLSILFSTQAVYDTDTEWEDTILDTFREVGQSNKKIIEFLHSLAFDWSDHLTIQPLDLKYLAQLPLHSCTRKDISGCEVIDRAALHSLLTFARRSLLSQNKSTPANADQIRLESQYILESCAVENHRREVVFAASNGFEAWRKMLDMTLLRCFHRLPHDLRENMLFDLLHILPTILHSSEVEDSTAVLLAELTLSTITKLRDDRQEQMLLASLSGDPESNVLPAERLYAVLKNILECVVDNSRLEMVRGNLYASIVNYVHLITPGASTPASTSNLAMSMTLASSHSIVPQSPTTSTSVQSQLTVIQANSLALMKPGLERLITTISRDAIDGSEVWKTVAFMLLAAICRLSEAAKDVTLSYLVRQGILSNFVHGVGEADTALQAVLKPDPDDLNALYVYESKMALFIQIAHSRTGAERLLDDNVIAVLGQCDFLDAWPEGDQDFMDQDTFLPSAVQRYHQLFMPAIELVNAIVATLGAKHVSAADQALDFLLKHSPTIVILLRNEQDQDQASLALLEEIHLLVSLATNVLGAVPKTELTPSSTAGFGAIHASVLALSTQCLVKGSWITNIRPLTDGEVVNAGVPAGFGEESKFRANLREKGGLVRKSIVAYLGAASEFTEPELNVMISPSTAVTRPGAYIATLPTLGDIILCLDGVLEDLETVLNHLLFVRSELDAPEHVNISNLPPLNADLTITQKRHLVIQQYQKVQEKMRCEMRGVVHTAEMVLLLLWRHVMYYCDGQGQEQRSEKGSRVVRMPAEFKDELGRAMTPVLAHLRGVRIGEWEGENGREREAYIEIMDRRLRDVVGLYGDGEELGDVFM